MDAGISARKKAAMVVLSALFVVSVVFISVFAGISLTLYALKRGARVVLTQPANVLSEVFMLVVPQKLAATALFAVYKYIGKKWAACPDGVPVCPCCGWHAAKDHKRAGADVGATVN